MARLQDAIRDQDEEQLIEILVRIGEQLRSGESGTKLAQVLLHAAYSAEAPSEKAILAIALAAYSNVPKGFYADLLRAPGTDSRVACAVAFACALDAVPEEWDHDSQRLFWHEVLVHEPRLLPTCSREARRASTTGRLEGGVDAIRSSGINFVYLSKLHKQRISDPMIVGALFDYVSQAGPDAVPVLKHLLASWDFRSEEVLSRCSSEYFRTSDRDVRAVLCMYLRNAPPALAARELKRVYYLETDPRSRACAAAFLLEGGGRGCATLFRVVFEGETDGHVRAAMVDAIAKVAQADALAELRRATADPDARVRIAIADGLSSYHRAFQRSEKEDLVLLLLRDPESAVRCSAVRALAELSPERAAAELPKLAESDPSEQVRSTARILLGTIHER